MDFCFNEKNKALVFHWKAKNLVEDDKNCDNGANI